MTQLIIQKIQGLCSHPVEFRLEQFTKFDYKITPKPFALRYKEMMMTFTANNVAIGSTPKFTMVLQDGEKLFYPSFVLYRLQGQDSKTLEWKNVTDIKKIESQSSQIDIVLTQEETSIFPDTNLNRRLIVQVAYTDAGQTLSNSQEIEFQLQAIPLLQEEYEPPVPEVESLQITGGVNQGLKRGFIYQIDFNQPISEILLVEVGLWDEITSEVIYEECDSYVLSGNGSILVFYENTDVPSGVEVYFRITVKTQISKETKVLEVTLVN